MKVNLVIPDNWGWVLRKIAVRLKRHVELLGHEVSITPIADDNSDINHFLFHTTVPNRRIKGSTLFITHTDSFVKASALKNILDNYIDMGICMSNYHLDELVKFGIPDFRLTHCLPAADSRKKEKITFVILSNRYKDGKKNEWMLRALAQDCEMQRLRFVFHGIHWGPTCDYLQSRGVEAIWYPPKDDMEESYEDIHESLKNSEYYLYMGWDEGSLGSLDAFMSRKKMILSAQGFHLNLPNSNIQLFNDYPELKSIFHKIIDEENTFDTCINNLRWERYALEHLTIWDHILTPKRTTQMQPFTIKAYSNVASVFEPKRSILPLKFEERVFRKIRRVSVHFGSFTLIRYILKKFS